MSTAAERRDRMPRPARRWSVVAAVALLAVLATSAPASAIHQNCGDDLVGTGSHTNGHVDTAASNGRWAGIGIIQELDATVRGLQFARTAVRDVADLLVATSDLMHGFRVPAIKFGLTLPPPGPQLTFTADVPLSVAEVALRYTAVGFIVAEIVLFAAETAVSSTLFEFNRHVGDEAACGGTLVADTVSMIWVSIVERNLASDGPPLAILMAPHKPDLNSNQPEWPLLPQTKKNDFTWCPPIEGEYTGELPRADAGAVASTALLPETGGDCVSTVHLGFLDAPTLGVKDIVTSTIGHLEAHGVDVRGARAILDDADDALTATAYSDAFHLYRDAYQTAMEVPAS